MTDFDLNIDHVNESFEGDIPIEEKEWNVGLIVGGSGTGKSTIAKEIFGNYYVTGYRYANRSVLDDMPENKSVKDIESTFTSVGFASPPSWLKPYRVLSTGEKMRVDLARAILEDREIICFDEFTSVVDRDVAKTASYSVSKAIKRNGKKFVAISCHRDIIEWLEPDWIYDTDDRSFFTRGEKLTVPESELTCTGLIILLKSQYGEYLGSITI